MDIAQGLRKARKSADKSQAEIAEFLKTSRTNYIRYEMGQCDIPVKHLIALADLYKLTLDELVGRSV